MEINKYIDYTLLKPVTSDRDIMDAVDTANAKKYYSFCTYPIYLSIVNVNKSKDLKVSCVFNFPNGQQGREITNYEIDFYKSNFDEIDVVMPFYMIKNDNWGEFDGWCYSLRSKFPDKIIKVIIEIGYWDEPTIWNICGVLIKNNINFVKTCTGFTSRGVTLEDIKLLKKICEDKIKIKASGSIKTLTFAEDIIAAGADRIGTSTIL
jgi:deoxyribose-phosphate aldolase